MKTLAVIVLAAVLVAAFGFGYGFGTRLADRAFTRFRERAEKGRV